MKLLPKYSYWLRWDCGRTTSHLSVIVSIGNRSVEFTYRRPMRACRVVRGGTKQRHTAAGLRRFRDGLAAPSGPTSRPRIARRIPRITGMVTARCDPVQSTDYGTFAFAARKRSVDDHAVTVDYEDITLQPFDPPPDHRMTLEFTAIAKRRPVIEGPHFLSVGGACRSDGGPDATHRHHRFRTLPHVEDLLHSAPSREVTVAEIAGQPSGRSPSPQAERGRLLEASGRDPAPSHAGRLHTPRRSSPFPADVPPDSARTLDSTPRTN